MERLAALVEIERKIKRGSNLKLFVLKHVALGLTVVSLIGCGGSGSNLTSPSQSYPSLTGNWAVTANSTVAHATIDIGASIVSTEGNVTGVLHVLTSNCYAWNTDVPFSGTESTTGAVSLTTSPVANQVMTIKGTMTSSSLSGTYTVVGGCAGGDSGTLSGQTVPAYNVTMNGTFLSKSGLSVPVSIVTTQTGPDIHGMFPVTGTVTFTNSPCFATGTITNSIVTGDVIAVTITANDGSYVAFSGWNTSGTITGLYSVSGGKCSFDSGTGTVTIKNSGPPPVVSASPIDGNWYLTLFDSAGNGVEGYKIHLSQDPTGFVTGFDIPVANPPYNWCYWNEPATYTGQMAGDSLTLRRTTAPNQYGVVMYATTTTGTLSADESKVTGAWTGTGCINAPGMPQGGIPGIPGAATLTRQ